MSDTTTLDKLYLEYSNLTAAKTAKELKLEAENERLRKTLMQIADGLGVDLPTLIKRVDSAHKAAIAAAERSHE